MQNFRKNIQFSYCDSQKKFQFPTGLNSFDDVLNVFKQARGCLGEILSACEMMDSIGYDKTIEGFKLNNPFGEKYKFYMLLETRSSMDGNDLEKVNGFLEKMMEKGLALDGLVTDEPAKIKVIKYFFLSNDICSESYI